MGGLVGGMGTTSPSGDNPQEMNTVVINRRSYRRNFMLLSKVLSHLPTLRERESNWHFAFNDLYDA